MGVKTGYGSLHVKHREQLETRRLCAQVVLGELRRHLPFRSVLDVGCGVGAWLAAAQELGAEDVFGVDGPWVPRDLLAFDPDRFQGQDLNQPFDLGRRFDLCISIEVGEHVKPGSTAGLVASIARHADAVLFSAALPGQGGTGHVNELWPEVWAHRFDEAGYDCFDPVRRSHWGDQRVLPWVQQNALVFLRRGTPVPEGLEPFRVQGQVPTHVHRVTYNRLRRRLGKAEQALAEREAAPPPPPAAPPAVVAPPPPPPAPVVLPGGLDLSRRASAPEVTSMIEAALAADRPLSLIRLSHCEAKFLNWPDVFTRKEVDRSLLRQFGYKDLGAQDLLDIAAMIRASVACADIVGIPQFSANDRARLEAGDEGMRLWAAVEPACLRYGLLRGDAVAASVNIHLRLQEGDFLPRMAAATRSLTLVGCRDLRPQFQALGFAEVAHVPVPEAARTRPEGVQVQRHYPDAFGEIVARIRAERRRGLFLVGAGFLGKIYCREIRLAGGIAVDVGSAMDVWAGVPSRTGFESRVAAFAL